MRKKEIDMHLFTRFEDYLKSKDYSPISITGYLHDTRYFARWFEMNTEQPFTMSAYGPGDIQAFRQAMVRRGLKPSTINRRLASIVALGKWGVEMETIDHNPGLHIRGLDSVLLAPKWLDKKQRNALLRAARDDLALAKERLPRMWLYRLRDTAIVILLTYTGLRVHEVCKLTMDDVQISPRKGQVTVNGKGYKQRTIPLSKPARDILQEWINHRPPSECDNLFLTMQGGPMKSRSVQRAIKRIADVAGLDGAVTPHTLRHTFAKSLIDEGVSLEKVAKLLGHSNLNTTRVYITPSEQDLEEAVARLS